MIDELGEITVLVNGEEYRYEDAIVIDLADIVPDAVNRAKQSILDGCETYIVAEFEGGNIGDIVGNLITERIQNEIDNGSE